MVVFGIFVEASQTVGQLTVVQDKTVGIVSKCDLCIDNRDALRARILHEPSVPTDDSPIESPEDFLAQVAEKCKLKAGIAELLASKRLTMGIPAYHGQVCMSIMRQRRHVHPMCPIPRLCEDLGAIRMKCWIASMQGPEKQGEDRTSGWVHFVLRERMNV